MDSRVANQIICPEDDWTSAGRPAEEIQSDEPLSSEVVVVAVVAAEAGPPEWLETLVERNQRSKSRRREHGDQLRVGEQLLLPGARHRKGDDKDGENQTIPVKHDVILSTC